MRMLIILLTYHVSVTALNKVVSHHTLHKPPNHNPRDHDRDRDTNDTQTKQSHRVRTEGHGIKRTCNPGHQGDRILMPAARPQSTSVWYTGRLHMLA